MQWRELIEFEIAHLRLHDFKKLLYRSIPVELLPLFVVMTFISIKKGISLNQYYFNFLLSNKERNNHFSSIGIVFLHSLILIIESDEPAGQRNELKKNTTPCNMVFCSGRLIMSDDYMVMISIIASNNVERFIIFGRHHHHHHHHQRIQSFLSTMVHYHTCT